MPKLKGEASATARKIQKDFRSELATWEKIPNGWELADAADGQAMKRERERLRKRIAEITKRPDE
jgi:hypothetical protein